MRGAVKDADTEKKIRELYEKAYGLDVVKPRFQETRQAFNELRQEHQQITHDIQELRGFYAKGDFDSFFEKLSIPQEKIFQWVLDKANYNELPPEQRQAMDQQRMANKRAETVEKQMQQLQSQYQEQISHATQYALDLAIERPEVKTFAQQFDERVGQPGAFRQAVIERGEWAWDKKGVYLTPEQAIQEVFKLAGYVPAAAQPNPAPGAQAVGGQKAPAQTVVVQQQQKDVIPNVTGKGTSPAKSRPKNLEDLKKLAAQMS